MRVERRSMLGMGLLSLLASYWKPAAAKAAVSDIAEFRQTIMAIIRDRHLADNVVPDAADPAKFRMTVHGVQSTNDVTNVFGYINSYPDQDSAAIIDRFIRSITYDYDKPVSEGDLVAVLRTQDYLGQAGSDIRREPLGADLIIVYMVDEPESMRPLSKRDLPGKSLEDLRKIALDNVRKSLSKVVVDGDLGDGALYYVEGNTMLSASLILLDDFWESVAKRFPGDVLIALPRKDQLFLLDDTPQAKAGARRLIDVTMADNFNLLSPQLYARRAGKIVAVTG